MTELFVSSFIGGGVPLRDKNINITPPKGYEERWANAMNAMDSEIDDNATVFFVTKDGSVISYSDMDAIKADEKVQLSDQLKRTDKGFTVYFEPAETFTGGRVPDGANRVIMFEYAFKDACKPSGKCALHILTALVDFANAPNTDKELLKVLEYHASYDMLTALYLILQPYRTGPKYMDENEFEEFMAFFKKNSEEVDGDYTYQDNIKKNNTYVKLIEERTKLHTVELTGKKSIQLLGEFYSKNPEHYPMRLKALDSEGDGGLMLFLCEVETRIMAYTRYLPPYEGMENFYLSCFKLDEPFILNKNKILSEMMIGSYIHVGLLSDALSRRIDGRPVTTVENIKKGTYLSLEKVWENCYNM